jgi:hypothetical protein
MDDYRWLIGDDAVPWLAQAADQSRSLVVRASQFRKHLSAARVRLVLEQVELRRRAAEKFPQSARMFFTRKGLEQATDAWVAAYKAARFPAGETVADLCCGIGGDLLALALRGPSVGVDRDPVAGLLAEANLRALGQLPPGTVAAVGALDVCEASITGFTAWHIDPDRRPAGRRTTRAEFHDPSPAVIEQWLSRCPDAAVKLAPAAELPQHWGRAAEAEWIGRDRQCRQLVAWFGRLARHPGRRSATVLSHSPDGTGVSARTVVETDGSALPFAGGLGRYVLEPDPAVLAADLPGVLAAEHGLAALVPGGGYLTGDRPVVDDPALACFEVLESLPFDLKRLRQLLTAHDIGRLEIKKRGVAEDPQSLRRRLGLRGSQAAVLVIAPLGNSVTAMLCRRRMKDDMSRG